MAAGPRSRSQRARSKRPSSEDCWPLSRLGRALGIDREAVMYEATPGELHLVFPLDQPVDPERLEEDEGNANEVVGSRCVDPSVILNEVEVPKPAEAPPPSQAGALKVLAALVALAALLAVVFFLAAAKQNSKIEADWQQEAREDGVDPNDSAAFEEWKRKNGKTHRVKPTEGF